MMKPRSIILALALGGIGLGLSGCVSDGLSPRETQSQNYPLYLYSQFSGNASEAPTTRPTISTPISVTVVQIGEVAPPREMLDELQAHSALFGHVESLPGIFDLPDQQANDQSYSSYYSDPASRSIRETHLAQQHLRQMRQAALNLGTQYLLIMGGVIDHSNDPTPLTLANITIVGMFVVPSQQLHATGKACAFLINAQTGQVILTATADAARDTLSPSAVASGDEQRLLESVRNKLVKNVTQEIIARMGGERVIQAETSK
jgi:hypothetical protein